MGVTEVVVGRRRGSAPGDKGLDMGEKGVSPVEVEFERIEAERIVRGGVTGESSISAKSAFSRYVVTNEILFVWWVH